MRRLSLSWVVASSLVLALICSGALIYADQSLNSAGSYRRLPTLNKPSPTAKLKINGASSTQTFPSAQTGGTANPQAAAPAQPSTQAIAPKESAPINPAPCKGLINSRGECSSILCPESAMSWYDRCGGCGNTPQQYACIVE
jgi:hypothetical protein